MCDVRFSPGFGPLSESLRQRGKFGSAKAAHAQRRRLVCGVEKRSPECGARRRTRAQGGSPPTATTRKPGRALSRLGRRRGGGSGERPAAPFISPSAPARDSARLPFCGAAAISRGRGGSGTGEGRAPPRPAGGGAGDGARAAPSSEGERVPFVLRLWAGAPPPCRSAAGAGRVRSPRLAAEGRARSPKSPLPSEPFHREARHPYPRSVKGVRFIGPRPEHHRGKP